MNALPKNVCASFRVALAAVVVTLPLVAQTARHVSATDASLRQKIEAFLNRSIGWQGLDSIQVASIGPADASGFRKVQVHVKKGEQQADETYYVTADGRKIIQGQIENLSGDPWRGNRERLQRALAGAPSEGPQNAPVTVVEFSDLECPHCKNASGVLQQVSQDMSQRVRIVFKNFPLVNIHPWSMQAAIGAECVTEQNPRSFWTYAQAVFDHQDQLTPENAPGRLRDFAMESGANVSQFDSCVASPEARRRVEDSIHEGEAVGVKSTPTLFINGREIDGVPTDQNGQPSPQILEQLIAHEARVAPEYDRASTGAIATGLKGAQCGHCEALPPPPK
jgi:protein-disulfide isomerase